MTSPDRLYQVFLSSTYEDLRAERSAAIAALLETDCVPVGMEYFPAADTDQWTAVKRLIDASDYYVLITAARYGSVEKTSGLSYTELEYDYAIKADVPVLAFLHHDIGEISAKLHESTDAARKRLKHFHEKVKQKLCRFYTNSDDLASAIKSSITKLKKSSPRPGWLRGTDTAVGYVPIRFDLNDSSLRSADDDPISIFDSPRAVLGYGVTLSATLLQRDESMKSRLGDQSAMYAVTTDWGRFERGFARSGWLFHLWFPNDMPIHTFSPHWVFDKNMRHAAVFFKIHVMPDNSGYIHLCAMSSYHYLIRLHTTAGTERSGEFSWSPSHAAEMVHDTWPFSCHFESTKETAS